MPGAPLLIRSNETPRAASAFSTAEPIGDVVGRDEVERAIGEAGPQRVAVGRRPERRRDHEARARDRIGLVVALSVRAR